MAKTNNAVTKAAESAAGALDRFQATETFAQKLFRPEGKKTTQALLANGNLHVVATDGRTTLEISDGKVAVSVADE